MEKLLDATGSVWQLRMQAEEELRVAHEHLAAMTRSYGQAQQENERLRMALQDILDIQEIYDSAGIMDTCYVCGARLRGAHNGLCRDCLLDEAEAR
jgi:hypothetical protein